MSTGPFTFPQDLEQKPICVIGNFNIDLIIRNVPHLPVWGQEVMGTDHVQVSSGQTGYLAFALRCLGLPTTVIGNIGQDIYAEQILRDLEHYQLDVRGVEITPGAPTGITVAIVRPDGERAFVSNLGSLLAFDEEMALRHWDQAKDAGIFCLVGLFMIPNLNFAAATRLLSRARREGKLTMLDTGWDPNNWPDTTRRGFNDMLSETSIFLPNIDEACALTGKGTPEEAAVALQALGPPMVVVKCGSQGSHLRVGELSLTLPAREVSVFDAVGAGDVFNSGFLYALRRRLPWDACLAMGNSSASLYISRAENRFPSLGEVLSTARSSYPGISIQGPVHQN